jgi:hypothetical protein
MLPSKRSRWIRRRQQSSGHQMFAHFSHPLSFARKKAAHFRAAFLNPPEFAARLQISREVPL